MKRGFYSKSSLHFSHPLTGPTDPTGGVPFDRAGPCASHVARLALDPPTPSVRVRRVFSGGWVIHGAAVCFSFEAKKKKNTPSLDIAKVRVRSIFQPTF
jgi:hypothetical protein